MALSREGKYDEALLLHEQLVAAVEAEHGPNHPKVAEGLINKAQVFWVLRDFNSAQRTAARALEILKSTLDSEDPAVVDCEELFLLMSGTAFQLHLMRHFPVSTIMSI
jgi:hypothetical protein